MSGRESVPDRTGSAFHGVGFPIAWCKRYGLPCSLDDRCCGQLEMTRVVSLDYALDVEHGLRKALRLIRDELSNGVTANWDFIEQEFSRALDEQSAKTEGS